MSANDRRAAYSEAEFQANLVRRELLPVIEALAKRVEALEQLLREARP